VDTYSYASTPLLGHLPTQAVWAISGDDPEKVSAHQVAQRMNIRMTQPHLVWNPLDGELVQMMEADRENRYLPVPSLRRAFSILVVAQDVPVFTDYPEQHLMELLTHIPESIPSSWPLGPPSTLGLMPPGPAIKPGHYSVDQISAHGIPTGAIDIRRMASK
jgi:hypothetical protein